MGRKLTHLSQLRLGKHVNSRMQEEFSKFGEKAFAFEIIEFIERRDKLYGREMYWIDKLKPEYNINSSTTMLYRKEWSKTERKDLEVLCLIVDTDPILFKKIQKRTSISSEKLEEMLNYNMFTVRQFAKLSLLSLTEINAKLKPLFVSGKFFDPELDCCYPFRDLQGKGPKMIVRNENSERYL